MSGLYCDNCGYNRMNGDCTCPERAGLATAVLAKRVRELEHGRATAPDPVNHPPHYTFGKIEVIDAIEDWGLGFHDGNVVKYVARARHKGTQLQDLEKDRWYLDRLISKAARIGTPDAAGREAQDGHRNAD